MKKLILLFAILIPCFLKAQNTVTLESGTAPLPTFSLRYKGITPDSLNHLWLYWNGKYNRMVTMTEANQLYAPIVGGGYVPTTRQVLNGYGIAGGTQLNTDITKRVDTSTIVAKVYFNSNTGTTTQAQINSLIANGAVVVSSIAALQAISGTSTTAILTDTLRGKVINTFNYYPSATTTVDNGIIFAAMGKGMGRWVRQYSGGYLYPEWWDARPYDPVTNTGADAASAIQSAINYFPHRASTVIISNKFRSSAPIIMGETTHILGLNAGFPFQVFGGDTLRYKVQSGIYFTSGTNGLVAANDVVDYRAMWMHIDHVGIFGTGSNNGKSGILLKSNPNATTASKTVGGPKISDCFIDGFSVGVNGNFEADGIWMERTHISNSKTAYRSGQGEDKIYYNITYLTDTAFSVKSYRSVFTGNEIENFNIGIVAQNINVAGMVGTPFQVTILANQFSLGNKHIVINGGKHNIISYNIHENPLDTAITVSNSTNNSFIGNKLSNQSSVTPNTPYIYLNSTFFTSFDDNTFNNPNGSYLNKVGIEAFNSANISMGSQNVASTNITNGLITLTGTSTIATDAFRGNVTIAGTTTSTGDVTAPNYRFPSNNTGSVASSVNQATNVWTQNVTAQSGSSIAIGTQGANTVNWKYNNVNVIQLNGSAFQPVTDLGYSSGSASNRWSTVFTNNLQLGLTGIFKGNGPGANVTPAVANTDYLPVASPAMTGTPTAPTAAAGTNTTQLATMAALFAERSNTAALTNKTINGNTVTPGTGTLTLAAGKILTVNNTITLNGIDGSTLNVGGGGTLQSGAFIAAPLQGAAALDFPSTLPGANSVLTVTISGAAIGDAVVLGIANASVPGTNCSFMAWVSAVDTVSVRFSNNDSVTTVDPASGSFNIRIIK